MAVAEKTVAGETIRNSKLVARDRDTGAWAWALQRFTAVVVGVFIAIHIYALHMAKSTPGPVTFESVRERVSGTAFQVVDLLLLASLLYHALNGVRNVLLDFGVGAKSQKLMAGVFTFIGVIAFAYGVLALIPFMRGEALFR